MSTFYIRVIIYLLCFFLSMYGLMALDFSKFILKGKVRQTYVLYFVLACSLAYLFGNFLMSIIYFFY